MIIAGLPESFTHKQILLCTLIIRRLRILASAHHPGKSAAVFDAQLVCRDMLRMPQDYFIKCGSKRLKAQLGKSEDNVYAVFSDAPGPEHLEGGSGPIGVMAVVHPPRDAIIQGLHSPAVPVDSKIREAMQIGRPVFDDVLSVDFHGKFIKWRESDAIYNLSKTRKRQHRRGAASYIRSEERRVGKECRSR